MNYTTQMDAAKKGIWTPQMEDVFQYESIAKDLLIERIASGEIAVPANRNHKNLKARGVGKGLKTKINVNLGVSEDVCNREMEMRKADLALKYNADAVMDLSTFGDTQAFRRQLVEKLPIMLGTVPMYDAVARYGKNIAAMTKEDLFRVVELHCEDGIDFLTIHAGLNLTAAERVDRNPRQTGIVSRGGSILYEWMKRNGKENPFYEDFDRLLDICGRYDVTLSLGDGLRPGSLKDATDAPQVTELVILGELTKRAWERNVQVMIEGPPVTIISLRPSAAPSPRPRAPTFSVMSPRPSTCVSPTRRTSKKALWHRKSRHMRPILPKAFPVRSTGITGWERRAET